jgi:hypothetical protein
MAELADGTEAKDKLKVFVSYSRSDIDFADQLVLALEDKGFEPIIDRHDIDPGEKWKDRLGALIFSCDTVVFVLSERSAGSPICRWEVDEAERLNKPMIPVAPQAFDGDPPPQLAEINYIHFYRTEAIPGSGFYRGVQELEQALKTDLDWKREATRVAEQAALWRGRGDNLDLLWRGEVLGDAHAWLARTPPGQVVGDLVHDFLKASQAEEDRRKLEAAAGLKEREEALAKAQAATRRVRRATLIGLFATMVVGALAIWTTWLLATVIVSNSEWRGDLFAIEATRVGKEKRPSDKVILTAERGTWEPLLTGSTGFVSVQKAAANVITSTRLSGVFETDGPIFAVAFSPDGQSVLIGSDDNKARLYDIHTSSSPKAQKIKSASLARSCGTCTVPANHWRFGWRTRSVIPSCAVSPRTRTIPAGCGARVRGMWNE